MTALKSFVKSDDLEDRVVREHQDAKPAVGYGLVNVWTDPSDGKSYLVTRVHDGTSGGKVVGVEATEIT